MRHSPTQMESESNRHAILPCRLHFRMHLSCAVPFNAMRTSRVVISAGISAAAKRSMNSSDRLDGQHFGLTPKFCVSPYTKFLHFCLFAFVWHRNAIPLEYTAMNKNHGKKPGLKSKEIAAS